MRPICDEMWFCNRSSGAVANLKKNLKILFWTAFIPREWGRRGAAKGRRRYLRRNEPPQALLRFLHLQLTRPQRRARPLRRHRGARCEAPPQFQGPAAAAASSLCVVCLRELYNGLSTLKLLSCSGEWDELLQSLPTRHSSLAEIHLERAQVSDRGLAVIAALLRPRDPPPSQVPRVRSPPRCGWRRWTPIAAPPLSSVLLQSLLPPTPRSMVLQMIYENNFNLHHNYVKKKTEKSELRCECRERWWNWYQDLEVKWWNWENVSLRLGREEEGRGEIGRHDQRRPRDLPPPLPPLGAALKRPFFF